ncbi:hypothetical protein ABZQ13_31215, partial [Pseudomonas aeruginosa]
HQPYRFQLEFQRVLRPLCLACHHISPCFSLTSARDSFCGGKLNVLGQPGRVTGTAADTLSIYQHVERCITNR